MKRADAAPSETPNCDLSQFGRVGPTKYQDSPLNWTRTADFPILVDEPKGIRTMPQSPAPGTFTFIEQKIRAASSGTGFSKDFEGLYDVWPRLDLLIYTRDRGPRLSPTLANSSRWSEQHSLSRAEPVRSCR